MDFTPKTKAGALAQMGASALVVAGVCGVAWNLPDWLDSQLQASDKTAEQAVDTATAAPTLEITASNEPSPADLEPLEAVVPGKTDYEKAQDYAMSIERTDYLNDVMKGAAEAVVEKCASDGECFVYYPEAGYSYNLLQTPTDMWGILQHSPDQGGSSDNQYGAEVYFGSGGEVDLSKGARSVFATTGFDAGDLYGGSIWVGRDGVLRTQETNFSTLGDNRYRFSDSHGRDNAEALEEIDDNAVNAIHAVLDMPKE